MNFQSHCMTWYSYQGPALHQPITATLSAKSRILVSLSDYLADASDMDQGHSFEAPEGPPTEATYFQNTTQPDDTGGSGWNFYIDGLVQERRNSSAFAMVLRLSCTKPAIWNHTSTHWWRDKKDSIFFSDDIFRFILLHENCCILIQISQEYIPNGPIDNEPALVQIMSWRQIGARPSSEPVVA